MSLPSLKLMSVCLEIRDGAGIDCFGKKWRAHKLKIVNRVWKKIKSNFTQTGRRPLFSFPPLPKKNLLKNVPFPLHPSLHFWGLKTSRVIMSPISHRRTTDATFSSDDIPALPFTPRKPETFELFFFRGKKPLSCVQAAVSKLLFVCTPTKFPPTAKAMIEGRRRREKRQSCCFGLHDALSQEEYGKRFNYPQREVAFLNIYHSTEGGKGGPRRRDA